MNKYIPVKVGDSEGFLENNPEFWIITKMKTKPLITRQICTEPFKLEKLKEIHPREIGNANCWFRTDLGHKGNIRYAKAVNVE